MGRTVINVGAVLDATVRINSAKASISNARSSFNQTKNSVDSKIKNRSNIRERLNNVNRQLADIYSNVNRIGSTVQSGAYQYRATDKKVEAMKKQVCVSIQSKAVAPQNGKWADYFKTTADKIRLDGAKEGEKKKLTLADGLNFESKILGALSKLIKDKGKANDASIVSSATSYISGLYTFFTTEHTDSDSVISAGLKLIKNSTSMWEGTYKYLEKGLTPIKASRFGKKFQGKVGVVSLVGSFCGFSSDAVNTFKTLLNNDADTTEKIDAVLTNAHSGLDVAQSAVNLKYGQKVLTRGVTAKYQWGVAAKNAGKLDNATAAVSVLGVTVDSIKGANAKYGEVTADGNLNMGDMGEIGISTSVHGLTSVVGKATFGITDVLGLPEKADDITEGIINFAENEGADFVRNHEYSSNYVKNAQFLMDYANDENNNIVSRVGAASAAGLGMIGAVTVDGISDGLNWMGGQISSGWNAFKSIF